MQAHYAYLRSPDPDTIAFLTSDIQRLTNEIGSLFGSFAGQRAPPASLDYLEYQRAVVSKGLTVIPLVVTIILCGIVGFLSLYDATSSALVYTRERVGEIAWREKVGISDGERKSVEKTSEFAAFVAIIPQYGLVYLAVCGLLLLSIVLSSFFVFLCSAGVVFMYRLASRHLLPASRADAA
jgi:hypothetical protein